ncbi:NETI motif-containing protein [Aquibacillus sediminis]|uniref:NETI motif-containing protein n=1 Tax=Aquibacillus sediminis TaxID=2574734 RepID=UPI0011083404|nr:NETI motif-containing protein [Aquibacillus sediminis]
MKRKKQHKQQQNNKQKNKKRFELQDGESIDQCLDRIKSQGYTPIRRTEQPIFQEVEQNGEVSYQPHGRKIIFDAVLKKGEQ